MYLSNFEEPEHHSTNKGGVDELQDMDKEVEKYKKDAVLSQLLF